jgi:hypothetical protein
MKNLQAVLRYFVPLLLLSAFSVAKDQPAQVILWPDANAPVLRFTLGKFKEAGSFGNRRTYLIDTVAENLSSKPIGAATFSLYLFDKGKVRIGEGWIHLSNVDPGQSVKFQLNVNTSGAPLSASIVPAGDIDKAKSVSVTVNSVPQGATLKVDGADIGSTPKLVQVGIGKHMLEFSKEGFNTGHFPLEIGSNDVSGGSVSYELGSAAHDTVELRDGSVLSGDLESVSVAEVVVKVGGGLQHMSRNQVKRIVLVERDPVTQ